MSRRTREDVDTMFGASAATRKPADNSLVHIMRPRVSCTEPSGTSKFMEPRANRTQRMITTKVKPKANTTAS